MDWDKISFKFFFQKVCEECFEPFRTNRLYHKKCLACRTEEENKMIQKLAVFQSEQDLITCEECRSLLCFDNCPNYTQRTIDKATRVKIITKKTFLENP